MSLGKGPAACQGPPVGTPTVKNWREERKAHSKGRGGVAQARGSLLLVRVYGGGQDPRLRLTMVFLSAFCTV